MGRRKRQRAKQRLLQRAASASGVMSVRVVNSGYGDQAASHTRQAFKGFSSRSYSPQRDIIRHTRTLRSRARSLYMGAPIATSAIKSLRTSVVGRGLHLHVMPDFETLGITREEASAWARQVEREFDLWAESKQASDVAGLHDFYELQQLALAAWKMSGDAFCLLRHGKPSVLCPYSLRLQLVEADRICTPGSAVYDTALNYATAENGNKIYDGVEVDQRTGQVAAYHVASDYPSEGTPLQYERIEKYGKVTGMPNILHLMDAERPEQLRGVPFIAPVMESIMQLGQYLKSESLAALMETYLSGYITTEVTDAPILGAHAPKGVVTEEGEEEVEVQRDLSQLEPEPGGIRQLLPGESITFNDPKRPGTQFDPFVRSVAMQIGAALEIPADVLLKSYNSSYSASRAALQDFWRMVSMTRDWFASDFCGAVYAEWLAEAVSLGRVYAPGFFADPLKRKAWLGHEWNGAAMPHLDPVKEAQAMQAMTANGWLTHKQATTLLNGGDWESNIAELEAEAYKLYVVQGMARAAKTIKDNTDEDTEKQ